MSQEFNPKSLDAVLATIQSDLGSIVKRNTEHDLEFREFKREMRGCLDDVSKTLEDIQRWRWRLYGGAVALGCLCGGLSGGGAKLLVTLFKP